LQWVEAHRLILIGNELKLESAKNFVKIRKAALGGKGGLPSEKKKELSERESFADFGREREKEHIFPPRVAQI